MESVAWDDLWNWCLQRHYTLNEHHPEHFRHPLLMPRTAKLQLTCDLLGAVMGVALKYNVEMSIEDSRSVIEYGNQYWRSWKYALKENLPEASLLDPPIPNRWKHFPEEEKEKLKELYERLQNGESETEIRKELGELECIKYYMDDLERHRQGVRRAWELVKPYYPQYDITDKIANHDNDKYEVVMIIGYTKHYCFEEPIPVRKDYRSMFKSTRPDTAHETPEETSHEPVVEPEVETTTESTGEPEVETTTESTGEPEVERTYRRCSYRY